MLVSLLFTAACFVIEPTLAVFSDEAWSVDYHYALLGEPKEETTFFHQPNPSSRASLVYTLSEKSVLGAVNPRDGAVVWRQLPSHNASGQSFLRAGEGQDVIVSGIGSEVAAWSAADGRQVWSLETNGQIEDLEILELSDGKEISGAKDAVIITSGHHAAVRRLDSSSGAVKWKYRIESADVPYQVSASTTEVFATLLHKTMLGNIKIKVISLDPVTGHKKDEVVLGSDSELSSPDNIVSVGANSASPIIAWTDASYTNLKVNIIGTKEIASFKIEKQGDQAVQRVRLHAPYHVNSLSHFLVHYETASSHWADVFHVHPKNNRIEKAYSLPNIQGRGTFSTSSIDANVYFTRISEAEVTTVSSSSHGVLGRWEIKGAGRIIPFHAVSEASVKGDTVSAVRTAVLLSTGEWLLLRDGTPMWQRPEMLSDTIAAAFIASAEAEQLVEQLEAEAHSNPVSAYIHRVRRHIADLQRLPALLASLPNRIVKGFLGTSADGDVASDSFGFHQIIACVTRSGRLVALDAGNPERILWNKQVIELKPGQEWRPTIQSPRGGILSLHYPADAVGIQFNATNGEDVAHETPDLVDDFSLSLPSNVRYTMHGDALEGRMESGSVWQFVPIDGERILSLTPRPVNDPVASIGKVLGDRRVLYKYLDPNLALLVTGNDASRSATVYVLNTVSGAILYSNKHKGVDLTSPISSIASENWFAYSFTSEASEHSPKGNLLVVGELFESLAPNDRGPLSGASNFSSLHSSTSPFTLTQTYHTPETISKMAVTRTKQGITSRQLLAVLPDANAIVGIPYGILDPRRPVNRDPTKDEQAEGLVRYAPVLEFDPKWYLTHQREVVEIKDIVTSPASIESTSLVFAYGLDVFGTRLSPSFSFDILGKDFNKLQMLATVAALAVATFMVAPLVTRKQVDARWQFM